MEAVVESDANDYEFDEEDKAAIVSDIYSLLLLFCSFFHFILMAPFLLRPFLPPSLLSFFLLCSDLL